MSFSEALTKGFPALDRNAVEAAMLVSALEYTDLNEAMAVINFCRQKIGFNATHFYGAGTSGIVLGSERIPSGVFRIDRSPKEFIDSLPHNDGAAWLHSVFRTDDNILSEDDVYVFRFLPKAISYADASLSGEQKLAKEENHKFLISLVEAQGGKWNDAEPAQMMLLRHDGKFKPVIADVGFSMPGMGTYPEGTQPASQDQVREHALFQQPILTLLADQARKAINPEFSNMVKVPVINTTVTTRGVEPRY